MIASIPYGARRGVLSYWVGHDVETFEGWVRISMDGDSVDAQKIGGRQWFRLTGLDHVITFEEVAR